MAAAARDGDDVGRVGRGHAELRNRFVANDRRQPLAGGQIKFERGLDRAPSIEGNTPHLDGCRLGWDFRRLRIQTTPVYVATLTARGRH